jgi:3-deoxy-D-manno-octulosonate 8-phosphate phosphatase (KDO 8-P phosphatase)
MNSMSRARAKKIKLLLFDVDGVLTDGKLYIFPAPAASDSEVRAHKEKHADSGGYGIASTAMVEAKGFNAHDGAGISLAKLGGLQTGLITKRISETVALRARDLKLEHVYQGIIDKSACFSEILAKAGFDASQVAYIGDDIIDLPVMRRCGLAIAVPNGRASVKKEAHFVTEHAGGDGALRDAIEYILEAQGKLEKVSAEYIQAKRAHKKDP